MKVTAARYHDISCGHRVYGHESKCANLHGHNYRIHFEIAGELDPLGRVIDFSVIKQWLCEWLEHNWDHRFLIWERDPLADALSKLDETVVVVPFNPTAEHMATHLCSIVAPNAFRGTRLQLVSCIVEETRKCSARVVL
jgi:6-pyruvoyltetrahydropterin/6-carboxytetrahydropterin synthase